MTSSGLGATMLDVDRFLSCVRAASDSGLMTHMPYVVSDDIVLLSMRSGDAAWKAHAWLAGNGEFARVATGLPDSAVECCPQAEILDDGSVSFSVVSDHPYSFAVHSLAGRRLDSLAHVGIEATSHAGFRHGDSSSSTLKTVTMTRSGPIPETKLQLRFDAKSIVLRVLGNKQVLHVAPLAAGSFVATLYGRLDGEQAIVLSPGGDAASVAEIQVRNGERPYKPHIKDGVLFYARKIGSGFEDRAIHATAEFDFIPRAFCEWVEVIE